MAILKQLATLLLKNRFQTASAIQTHFDLSWETAEKFPILFPDGLTSDDFAKNLKLYNIPAANNTSLFALALIQQSKQNLIKNIQLFENSPQTFDPFLIRKNI